MLKAKLVVGGALFCAWVFACSGTTKNDFACAHGHASCSCHSDGACEDGLVCNSHHLCVKGAASALGGEAGESESPTGGKAATGGKSATGGDAATSGEGGFVSTGGTSTAGTSANRGGTGGRVSTGSGGDGAMSGAGATDAGSDAGGATSTEAGAGGATTGGTGGEDAGSGGGGGVAATGGSVGSGGTAGTGGSAGVGGTAGTGGTAAVGGTAGTGGSSAGGGGIGGKAGAGGKAGGGAGGGSACTELTIGSVMYYRDVTDAPDVTDYEYRTNQFGTTDPDYLEVAFYGSGFDPSDNGEAKGTFTLGTGIDANFKTCARCVLVDQDTQNQDGPIAQYFATSGTLVVASTSDQMNGVPKVTLSDVTLKEVTIDDNDTSTLVPNGRCVHVQTATVQIPAAWTCSVDWYASDDGCDCGCGARDGDCTNGNVSACDYCHCSSDTSDCTTVTTANNSVCK